MIKLTEKEKDLLRKMVDNKCQQCHKTQLELNEKLQIHRIIRGSSGGLYTPNNILILCKSCHKARHFKEWN